MTDDLGLDTGHRGEPPCARTWETTPGSGTPEATQARSLTGTATPSRPLTDTELEEGISGGRQEGT